MLYIVAQARGTSRRRRRHLARSGPQARAHLEVDGELESPRAKTQRIAGGPQRRAAVSARSGQPARIELSGPHRARSPSPASSIPAAPKTIRCSSISPSRKISPALTGKIGLVQLSVAGNSQTIDGLEPQLSQALPGYRSAAHPPGDRSRRHAAQPHPPAHRLHGVLILVLTALCVLATMAALAMERREDVGLMKALGGSISRIVGIISRRSGSARRAWAACSAASLASRCPTGWASAFSALRSRRAGKFFR